MEKHNHILKINEITTEKKNMFFKKTIFSIFIFVYILIGVMFCAFSNIEWTKYLFFELEWKDNDIYVIQSIFAILYMLWLIPFLIGAIYEINKLYFGTRSKLSFNLLLISGLILVICPNVMLIYFRYYQFIWTSSIESIYTFRYFIICLVASAILSFFSYLFLIFKYKINDPKKFISLLLIIALSYLGVFSIIFVGLLKGWIVVLYFFIIAVFSDTFAYIFGMLFGKHKMAPIISPKKTWEGFGIGLIVTTLLSVLIFYGLSFQKLPEGLNDNFANTSELILHWDEIYNAKKVYIYLFVCAFIIVISILSTMGDLFYSYIKRMHNIKDYSKLLKEHGGILDRFDSWFMSFSIYSLALFFITAITDSQLWVY